MVHGPGCPVCVLPIGRIDGAIALARDRGVILCTYADTMRVPASDGPLADEGQGRAGADIRMVYSCTDALRIARENPQRDVVFFAIGFETTTPPTALAILEARREGLANFSVFCNHVLTPAAITHILESPEVRDLGIVPLDGFIGPAHVSTVIGSQPYDYFAEEYRKPVVIAGFEPLDVMQAILMLVRQLNDGRARVENEFTRAVTPEGNAKAKALVAEVFELRRSFEWRGLGEVPYSALAIKPAYAEHDAERRYGIVVQGRPRSQGLRVRRDPARREEADRLQGLRHGLHAREPDRLVHGVLRGRVRGALHLRPLPGQTSPCSSSREGARMGPDRTWESDPVRKAYVRPIDFKRGRVDMTHGSGGRAMAQLIDELFARAFDNDYLRQGNDGALLAVPPGRLVMATDSHVVSPLFFPGGDIGCLSVHGTINDVAVMGARPLYLAAGFVLEEGFPLADLKRIVESMARRVARGGRPGRHRRHQGRRAGQGRRRVHHHHRRRRRARGRRRARRPGAARRRGAAVSGSHRRPRRGDHVAAREPHVRDDHRLRHRGAARPDRRRCSTPCPILHVLRDPTRGGLATTLNEIARQSGVRHRARRGGHSREAAGRGRVRVPRPRPAVRRQRRQADRGLRAGRCRSACWRRCARTRWARTPRSSARCIDDPHHFVQMDTRFGGRRVVDWLTGEQLPRIC